MLFRFLFVFFIVGFISAQNPYEKGSPLVTSLSSAQYGGEEQNFGFIQDEKGVLYVTNTIGFLEFNGATWRHFKPDNDGVPIISSAYCWIHINPWHDSWVDNVHIKT